MHCVAAVEPIAKHPGTKSSKAQRVLISVHDPANALRCSHRHHSLGERLKLRERITLADHLRV
jgi:hypothetical protein